jgi:hypothetical protein
MILSSYMHEQLAVAHRRDLLETAERARLAARLPTAHRCARACQDGLPVVTIAARDGLSVLTLRAHPAHDDAMRTTRSRLERDRLPLSPGRGTRATSLSPRGGHSSCSTTARQSARRPFRLSTALACRFIRCPPWWD